MLAENREEARQRADETTANVHFARPRDEAVRGREAPRLNQRTPPLDQSDDQYDEGHDQQEVDKAAEGIGRDEAQGPQDDEEDDERVHEGVSRRTSPWMPQTGRPVVSMFRT